jgi:cell division septation protein DedD
VELGEGNGGIVLNVGERGLAVQAIVSLISDELPCIRLQLAHTKKKVEARGRIAWTSDFRKIAGVEFIDLNPEALSQIREWVSLETPEGHGAEKAPVKKSEPVEPVAPVMAVPTHQQITIIAGDPPKVAADPENTIRDTILLQEPSPEPPAPPAQAESSAIPVVPSAPVVPEPKARLVAFISPPADRYNFQRVTQAQPTPPPMSFKTHSQRLFHKGLSQGTHSTWVATGLLSVFIFLGYYLHLQKTESSQKGREVTVEAKLPELSSKSFATKSLSLQPASDLPAFVLQVGAMAHEENANALRESLRQKNFPAFVPKRGTNRFYLVLVGPYSDADSTMRVKNELENWGFKAIRTKWRRRPASSVEITGQEPIGNFAR